MRESGVVLEGDPDDPSLVVRGTAYRQTGTVLATGTGRFLAGIVARVAQVNLDGLGRSLLQCREAFVAATGGA